LASRQNCPQAYIKRLAAEAVPDQLGYLEGRMFLFCPLTMAAANASRLGSERSIWDYATRHE
jgi:hypothetical protein